MNSPTDRIEKTVLLRASLERVWRALADAGEFGDWFGLELDGAFVPGAQINGRIKPTKVDPAVAEMQQKYVGMELALFVDRVEPMRLLSYRWHPFAVQRDVDYSNEPMTLVTFTLEPAEGGTLLRVVESGFDSIPLERRAAAFESNQGGWTIQMQLIEKFLVPAKA
jgi:uncharacterized protein YndB with AHSA1/START domain